MALTPGTKLGPYEIVSKIGAGGMGEVYRARDTKLGRSVALKVLPAEFAQDPERMARFRREAQMLASLNHPNIASIYGFEDSGGSHALVMELVEGPSLADRIKNGAIPIDEALPIAKQIAEGLEYAHDRGIVHRDLKPSNINLAANDAVKILDFGLAKALEGDPASVDVSSSPTISRMASQAGIILGTAAYMAPEQAKGKSVDRRADIWSFGCVLYEMLTGKMPFSGETVTDTLAAVIRAEPEWSALPATTPAPIRGLLQRCLKKDPKQRLQAIGDARIAIEDSVSGAAQDSSPSTATTVPQISIPAWRRALPWIVAGVAIAALLATLAIFWSPTRSAEPQPLELRLDIPSGLHPDAGSGPAVVLSPDGSRIAFVAAGTQQIYVRELDKPEAVPLEGARGVSLFFSPDGQSIGYYSTRGALEKVSVLGGTPVVVCEAGGARGGSWGEDGTIVFTTGFTTPLSRVSAGGGTPTPLTNFFKGRNEVTHRWPEILPGSKQVLFTASSDNNSFDHAWVEAASLATGQAKVLVENAYFGRYLAGGYLTYVSGGTLFAVPFDAKNLKLTGTAVPVLQNLQVDLTDGAAQISFSRNGTAVYLSGGNQVTVGLFDSKGLATPLVKQPGDYFSPSFSPDGKQLALQIGNGTISVYDLTRETMAPLISAPSGCVEPIWTPDEKMITCNRTSNELGVSWLPSNAAGNLKPLTPGIGAFQVPTSWSPDGRTLAFFQFSPSSSANAGACCEIFTLTVDASGQPGQAKPFFSQAHPGDSYPAISPDGHWMAYQSNESGTSQIYVVPFPNPAGKWQISAAGGVFPLWSKAGHTLFFLGPGSNGTGALFEAPYSVEGNSFQAGKPEVLFQGGFEFRSPYFPYDVAPDGKHFAMFEAEQAKTTGATLPTVVVNWLARVQSLLATNQK